MSTIDQRMRALRIEISPDVEERHLAAVARELRDPRPVPAPMPRSSRTPARRRFATVLASAAILLLPAAALGAERSVPGDFLYPVKQGTEWARSLIDPGVPERHRVQELEIVIQRGAPIEVVSERFADAGEASSGSPELALRVDQARAQIRERYGVDLDPASRGSGAGSRGTSDRSGDVGNDDGAPGGATSRDEAPRTATTSTTAQVPGRDDGGQGTITPSTTSAGTSTGTTERSQDRSRSGDAGSQP